MTGKSNPEAVVCEIRLVADLSLRNRVLNSGLEGDDAGF